MRLTVASLVPRPHSQFDWSRSKPRPARLWLNPCDPTQTQSAVYFPAEQLERDPVPGPTDESRRWSSRFGCTAAVDTTNTAKSGMV